jgi:hypothetical protein
MTLDPGVKILIYALMALIFGVSAYYFVLPYFISKRRSQQSQSWPETLGQVVKSGVRSKRVLTSYGYHTKTYQPNIVYHYSVDSRAYESSQLMFAENQFYGEHGWAKKIADRFPVDCQVRVYYDPADPEFSVLDRKSGFSQNKFATNLLLMGISAAMIFAVVGFTLR